MNELTKFDERFLENHGRIAGLDEAGRGALAGPVFVGCVSAARSALKDDNLSEVNDSKQLTGGTRDELFALLGKNREIEVGIGMASSCEIDDLGINDAANLAATRALSAVSSEIDLALLDRGLAPDLGVPVNTLEKGDERSFHVAGASILAKVARDRYMWLMAEKYPDYGWKSNVGYGTKEHRSAVSRLGRSPLHRKSYKIA
ncbi:MAG: ribonuclease HII [Candidatus Bipolaricaulota bacterium]|nr:ribonuclease HII [Candidatus Bipolaricaulota bacterium]